MAFADRVVPIQPVCLAFGLALGLSETSAFGTVNVRFAGVIDLVEAALPFSDQIAVGMPFEGTYSYESDAPDLDPEDPTFGVYLFTNNAMSVDIGTLRFSGADHVMLLSNQSSLDGYSVKNSSPFSAHDLSWGDMRISLKDLTGSALNSDALTLEPPDLADFQLRGFGLTQVGHREPSIEGTITFLTVIPEPAALMLLVVGAMCAGKRRRSWVQLGRPQSG